MKAIYDFFKDHFDLGGPLQRLTDEELAFPSRTVAVRDGIPRFTPDISYSTGNFSKLREEHSRLQFDSQNGTTDRRDQILRKSGWTAEFFQGKTLLECGCGAGPDTEVLASLGAKVMAVDQAGIDVAARNLARFDNVAHVQASIMDLPFKKKSFDIVYCHRVIHHTPDPEACLRHLMSFVRPGGHLFVDTYARNWTMLNWKYALLPITSRMNPDTLYNTIKFCGPFLYRLTSLLLKIPGGEVVNYFLVPFRNIKCFPSLAHMPDDYLIEYSVHDTFDALAPKYDRPLSAKAMRRAAAELLDRPAEIEEWKTITMLRTIPDGP